MKINNKKEYTCTYSKGCYQGECPVTNCHANLKSTLKHPSSCFFNVIKKTDYGAAEISYAYKIKLNKAKYRVKQEQKLLKRILVYDKILPKIRTIQKNYSFCEKCGIFYTKRKQNCKVVEKCYQRQLWIESILSNNTFPIENIQINAKDIWTILMNESLIHEYSLTVPDLFNCNVKLYNELKTFINNKLNYYDKIKIRSH